MVVIGLLTLYAKNDTFHSEKHGLCQNPHNTTILNCSLVCCEIAAQQVNACQSETGSAKGALRSGQHSEYHLHSNP